MWIDSHCHLTHERIRDFGSPETLVSEANAHSVDGMVTISCQISGDFKDQLETAKAHQNVWCTIGTHPHDAGLDSEKAITQEDIVQLAKAEDKIIGIGESGLDYYYDNSPRDDQASCFRKHIRACLETSLPIVVHSRDAEEDTAQILKVEGQGKLTGVMHCFSSRAVLAEKALEMGLYISFSGIVTFKAAEELREIAKMVPLDRILVETDAPFLAPVPYRGQTNQPAYVSKTGEFLAELLNITPEEMAKHTTENFFRVFPKAKKTWVQ
ncbi:MAG: TatD family hydrolase [Alphaproteobacteria bacterium]